MGRKVTLVLATSAIVIGMIALTLAILTNTRKTGSAIDLFVNGLLLLSVLLLLAAWLGALIKTATLKRWGWFASLLIFGLLSFPFVLPLPAVLLVYGLAGPTTAFPRQAQTQPRTGARIPTAKQPTSITGVSAIDPEGGRKEKRDLSVARVATAVSLTLLVTLFCASGAFGASRFFDLVSPPSPVSDDTLTTAVANATNAADGYAFAASDATEAAGETPTCGSAVMHPGDVCQTCIVGGGCLQAFETYDEALAFIQATQAAAATNVSQAQTSQEAAQQALAQAQAGHQAILAQQQAQLKSQHAADSLLAIIALIVCILSLVLVVLSSRIRSRVTKRASTTRTTTNAL